MCKFKGSIALLLEPVGPKFPMVSKCFMSSAYQSLFGVNKMPHINKPHLSDNNCTLETCDAHCLILKVWKFNCQGGK